MISAIGIDEKDFVKNVNKILMKDYTDIDYATRELIVKMSKTKDLTRRNEIRQLFNIIERAEFSEMIKNLQ